jgi:hypothetical protein
MSILPWLAVGLTLTAAPLPGQGQNETGWPAAGHLEEFLREAKIVGRAQVGTGYTNPVKLEGERHQAILKKIDMPDDSWRHEVAAYELDKLLGLGMVPPTVKRKDKGRLGCLQLWVEGAPMERLVGAPPDLDVWRQQVSAMWLFDYLTANNDRHVNNALASPEYRLLMIDNSRAFGVSGIPLRAMNEGGGATRALFWRIDFDPDLELYPTSYRSELVDRVRSLSEVELKATLGTYIDKPVRRQILERRDSILETIEEMRDPAP